MKRALAIAFLAAVAGGVIGYYWAGHRPPTDPESERSVTQLPEPSSSELAGPAGSAIDEPLMIALAQAKNFHHKADVYLREGKFAQAMASLEEILTIAFPDGAPEAEDVTLDARARMAKLAIARGELDRAMAIVEQGIAGAKRRSFFLANLHTARGEVYEAMANLLDESSDVDDGVDGKAAAEAREARRRAIEAFDQSISINRELQRALVGEGIR